MPNWCSNNIEVSGPAEDLARFKKTCIRPDNENNGEPFFDFNSVIPMPTNLKDTKADSDRDELMTIIQFKSALQKLGSEALKKKIGSEEFEKLRQLTETFEPQD